MSREKHLKLVGTKSRLAQQVDYSTVALLKFGVNPQGNNNSLESLVLPASNVPYQGKDGY